MLVASTLALTVIAAAPAVEVPAGQDLYQQPGATGCAYCHGANGENGQLRGAADLRHPRTWKTYAALGGDTAARADPPAFRRRLHDAVVDLIKVGAFAHNRNWQDPGIDPAHRPSFDVQMLGLGVPQARAWVQRRAGEGMTLDRAAEAVFTHVQSFDQDRVFRDGQGGKKR